MGYMLEIQNIHKTFNPGTINEKVALNGVNLNLNPGDFVTKYSNGYVEDLGYQDNFACSYVHATCTEQGYEILQCMLCDYREISNYTDPTGHIWDNGTISVAPTTETDGVRTFICTECGTTKQKRFPN